VRVRADRGYGPRRIARELAQRGLPAAAAARALAASGNDWAALARAAADKKFGQAPASLAERARQTRYLEYRGFAPEQIRHALGSSAHDEDL
jgi:regulatory protein